MKTSFVVLSVVSILYTSRGNQQNVTSGWASVCLNLIPIMICGVLPWCHEKLTTKQHTAVISPFNQNDELKLSSCFEATRETVLTGRRIWSLVHENESVAFQPSEVCLVDANIQQKEKTWPRLWKLSVEVRAGESCFHWQVVSKYPDKKSCVCARLCVSVSVCVMSSKVTAVGGGGTNGVLKNDLCRATSCENPTTLKRFPFHLDWIQKKHKNIQKVHLKLLLRWLSECWHFSGFSLVMWSQWWVVVKFRNSHQVHH